MPTIVTFTISPSKIAIKTGDTKVIRATLVIQSARNYAVIFALPQSNNFVLVHENDEGVYVESKRIEFRNNTGRMTQQTFSKDLSIRLPKDDDSTAIKIYAVVFDGLMNSLRVPSTLNIR